MLITLAASSCASSLATVLLLPRGAVGEDSVAAAEEEAMQLLQRFVPPFLSWPLLKAEDSRSVRQLEQ